MIEKEIKPKDLHGGWLQLEKIMLKRHGPELWGYMAQGMQGAYYMGAAAAAMSDLPRDTILALAGSGLGDALHIPNMKLVAG